MCEHNYTPSEEEKEESQMIDLHVGDVIIVSTHKYPDYLPCLQDQDLKSPKQWLSGKNTTAKTEGLFPGTFLRFVKMEEIAVNPAPNPRPKPRPRPRPKPSKTSTDNGRGSKDSGYTGSPSSKL